MEADAHPITLNRNDAEDLWLAVLYALRVAEYRGQNADHLRRIEVRLAAALYPFAVAS